ncbi:helix-turn-helix domain-containing protein [Labilibaculum euxinus]|uniref:Helix-turn-helix domain-containing protein n=1 Tax=Labilibaculum euxinus TaxID=2686357 RepID=A0A7M4D2E2_9BACT|nr:hypothetical protein [Labilibaculum euxinus]MUP36821.1 hypothetical protein [Labilibaculum euxinus]MVB06026.1 hypothetical protein [Labilibaculum euxinus]
MTKQITFSNFRFGLIQRDIITAPSISKNAKLVYSIIRAAQGGLKYIKTTQLEIADALGISERTTKSAFKDLKELGYLELHNKLKGCYSCPEVDTSNSGFGYVELDFLASSDYTANEKLLYTFFAAVHNTNDEYSHWSRAGIAKALSMTTRTYYPIQKSLVTKGLVYIIEGGKGKYAHKERIANRAFIARLENVEVAPSKYFNVFSDASGNSGQDIFEFPIIRSAPSAKVQIKQDERAKNDSLTGINCIHRYAEGTPNKKSNIKNNKRNNNKQESTIIIISDEIKSKFEQFWSYDPRGSKSSSLVSFSKLRSDEYPLFEDALEESNSVYGLLIKDIIADRKPEPTAEELEEKRIRQANRKPRKHSTLRMQL